MARAPAEKVGQGVCPDVGCGQPVMYRKSAGGMLSYRCDSCDSSGFAPPGSGAYKRRVATIKAPARDPIADPAPAPAPEPAPRKVASSVFQLGALS